MTRRERILGICVGGAVCGYLAVMAVDWLVLQPFSNIKKEIREQRADGNKFEKELHRLRNVEDDWVGMTGRTLATDPQDAQRRFREDMHGLLEVHGLSEPKISTGTFTKYKNGFIGVPLTVGATGTLKDIIGFLCDFYRAEYLARIDKLTISADQTVVSNVNNPKKSSRRSKSRDGNNYGPNGPELRLSFSALTLVLPPIKGLDHPVAEEVLREEQGRLPDELAAYNRIFDDNLFVPFQPRTVARAPAQREPTTKPAVKTQPRETVAEVKNPRPDAQFMKLVATDSINGEPRVFVLNERDRISEPEKYHHDDAVDDGFVLLILPRGMVVRTTEDGRKVDYYYNLGMTFADRERLDPDLHPEVVEAIKKAFVTEGDGPVEGAAERG